MLTISGYGQNYFIGVNAGANFTNVYDDDIFNEKVFKTGLCMGLTFDYLFGNRISLSADLIYTQKGFGNYYIFRGDFLGNGISGGRELVYFHYNYISIPTKIGYYVGEKFQGFGNIGLSPSYLVNSKTAFENGYSINETKKVTKFDLAGQIEMGCGYLYKGKFNIYSSISFAQSFIDLSNQNYFSSGNIRNYGITASLGLKYNFNRK